MTEKELADNIQNIQNIKSAEGVLLIRYHEPEQITSEEEYNNFYQMLDNLGDTFAQQGFYPMILPDEIQIRSTDLDTLHSILEQLQLLTKQVIELKETGKVSLTEEQVQDMMKKQRMINEKGEIITDGN